MANLTINGGQQGIYRDAIPSALRFTSWDYYRYWQDGGDDFNWNYSNFENSPVYSKTLVDAVNKKFFAIPKGMGSKYQHQYSKQAEQGFYKYDHSTNQCVFIKLDENDFYTHRSRFNDSNYYQYENFIYDESTDRLFILFYDKTLWEVDQVTGQLTQKTTCPIAGTIGAMVATGGYIYVLDSSRNFERYDIGGDSWSAMNAPAGSWSTSRSALKLITDGTYIVPANSSQASSTAWEKYTIGTNTWDLMTTTSAPTSSSQLHSEIFNGFLYVQYIGGNTNNYSTIWKYSLSGDTWTASALNLRTKGMTNGGAMYFFRANSKMYWVGTMEKQEYSGTSRSVQHHVIFEMDTAENFTDVTSSKYIPVPLGYFTYGRSGGYEYYTIAHQKSCGQYQVFSNFHSYIRSFRYIPYIDPVAKTVVWVKTPTEANKEREWQGDAFTIKDGKLYALDPYSYDLYVCDIGTWVWTKKDNLFTRIGSKVPYSCGSNSNGWRYGGGKQYQSGYNQAQVISCLFAMKGDPDLYLVTPRYDGSQDRAYYIYKYDVVLDQWSVLADTEIFPSGQYDWNNTNTSYDYRFNWAAHGSEVSSWVLITYRGYQSNQNYFVQYFYELDPTTGKFISRSGSSTTNWNGWYSFTYTGVPLWHTSSSWQKLYINDMDTMANDEINKYLEQYWDDSQKYIWQTELTDRVGVIVLDPANKELFQDSIAVYIQSSSSNQAFYNIWGFYKIVDSEKGGFFLGWKIKDISGQSEYRRDGRVLVDNDGVKSSIAAESLPLSIVDSTSVFTTKSKRNFKMYLEKHLATTAVSLVTYFAPKT